MGGTRVLVGRAAVARIHVKPEGLECLCAFNGTGKTVEIRHRTKE